MALNIKRLEELLDRRLFGQAVRAHDLLEPLALRPAARLVEADSLGVVVVDLAFAHGDQGAAARLVTVVVVQADLAEGREAHLSFTRSPSLRLLSKKLNDVTARAERPSSHVNHAHRLETSGA